MIARVLPMLPLLEKLGVATEPDDRMVYEAYFDGVPADAYAGLSDQDVFEQ